MEYKEETIEVRGLAAGLLTLGIISIIANYTADLLPRVNTLILAIVLGSMISNIIGIPSWIKPGIKQHKLLLETAIVLMGVRLTLEEIIGAGPLIIGLVFVTVLAGILIVESLSRYIFNLESKPASLLAAGASICGVSAVVAIAGAIQAKKEDITYTAAAILLFDAITIVLFPIAGSAMNLSNVEFGVWAGLSMFSTGPVAAAGFSYSSTAGEWATITKLARNSLIGVVAVGYSLIYAKSAIDEQSKPKLTDRILDIWRRFPKFLIGFLAVVVVANTGVFTASEVSTFNRISDWLFILAFTGLGFDIRLSEMSETGMIPLVTLFSSLFLISVLTLFVVIILV